MVSRQGALQTTERQTITYAMKFARLVHRAKIHLKGALLLLFVTMMWLMLTQLKSMEQERVVMVEKTCPKGNLHCLLIKDVTVSGENEPVYRTLVPENFPDFAVAQVILQKVTEKQGEIEVSLEESVTYVTSVNTGWKSWLPLFGRAKCRALAFLPADYQQTMLTAPFLMRSLRKVDDSVDHGRILFIGLGARSLASYINHHLFRVEIDELIWDEQDRYLSKLWYEQPIWNRVTVPKTREKDYDAIFIDSCLNTICPPTQIIAIAAQLNRTLKQNGVLVINVNAPTKNLLHRALKRVNGTLWKMYGCSAVAINGNHTTTLNKVIVYSKTVPANGCREMIKMFKKKIKSSHLYSFYNT